MHIVLTGATGILGSEILRTLLRKDGIRITCIVRAKNDHDALFRVVAVQQKLGGRELCSTGQLFAFAGDVSASLFGLEASRYDQLRSSVTHVIHCAASISLTQSGDEAYRQVFEPTKRVVEFLTAAPKILKFEHVSSVGVAGRGYQSLPEEIVLKSRDFRNTYEQAKADAEDFIRDQMIHLPATTLHRPSMIVGRSSDGGISSFGVFYFLSELLAGNYFGGSIPETGNKKLDIVAVDEIAENIVSSCLESWNHSLLHHCSGVTPLSYANLQDIAKSNLASPSRRGLSILEPAVFRRRYLEAPEGSKKSRLQRLAEVFLDYLEDDQRFQNNKTLEVLRRAGASNSASPRVLAELSIQYYVGRRRDEYWYKWVES